MLISAIDYNDYLGRIGIGKIQSGEVKIGDNIVLISREGNKSNAKISKLYIYRDFHRVEVVELFAGDIGAVAGLEDVNIGETIASPAKPEGLPFTAIDEPTLTMNFMVNNSPFAGQEGKYVTTRNISERLSRELKSNVSLNVEMTDSPDCFRVSGRGVLKGSEAQLAQLQADLQEEKEKCEQDSVKDTPRLRRLQMDINRIQGRETHASLDSELSMVLFEGYDLQVQYLFVD